MPRRILHLAGLLLAPTQSQRGSDSEVSALGFGERRILGQALISASLLLFACTSSRQEGERERVISPVSYSPYTAGVKCGAKLSELTLRRKNAVLVAEEPSAGEASYIDSADSELFSRL